MGSKPNLTTTTEYITPEIALEYLALARATRHLRKVFINTIVRDILADPTRWRVTHQGIAFDTHGRLIDGQHRLTAIAQSDRSVYMNVTRGVEPEAVDAVDRGRGRTICDITTLGDRETIHTSEVAATRKTMEGFSWRVVASSSEVIGFYDQHRDTIKHFTRLIQRNVSGLKSAHITAAVIRAAICGGDVGRLEEFCDILHDGGICQSPEDSAAGRLWSWLVTENGERKVARSLSLRFAIYRRALAAVQFFLERQPVKALHPAKKELFPIDWDKIGNPPKNGDAQ